MANIIKLPLDDESIDITVYDKFSRKDISLTWIRIINLYSTFSDIDFGDDYQVKQIQ